MCYLVWKNGKAAGMSRYCSFFVIACSGIHIQNFLVRPPPLEPFQHLRQFILPRQLELWHVFSFRQQTFSTGGLPMEEAIKTSAITITRAIKFIAMLRPLHFDTKIHTCTLNNFFVGKDMLQGRFERNFLESGNLICSG